MRIAVDANVILAQLLRRNGRALLTHPELQLFIAEYTWAEVREHLPARLAAQVQHGALDAALLQIALERALRLVGQYVYLVPMRHYAQYEATARLRVSDADDWHTAALALAYGAAILTEDRHFWGSGIAVWTTEKLRAHLGRNEARG